MNSTALLEMPLKRRRVMAELLHFYYGWTGMMESISQPGESDKWSHRGAILSDSELANVPRVKAHELQCL